MDFQKAKNIVLSILRKDLNPFLYYHNHRHTLDVIEAAERLCAMEDIHQQELIIVRTAALFHDTGFLWRYDDNERLACRFAADLLPDHDYTSEQIDSICEIIMSTRIPQNPGNNILAMILCDADLDYLGRDDFFHIALNLNQEWEEFHQKSLDFMEWYNTQFNFLIDHCYYTKAARSLREDKKKFNLSRIEELLSIINEVGNTEIAAGVLNKNK